MSGDGAILHREAPRGFFCKTLHLFAVGTAVLMCFITLLGLLGTYTRLLPLYPIKKSTLATIGLLLSLSVSSLAERRGKVT